jgi:hypothetical protein
MNTGAPLFGTINPTLLVVHNYRASISFRETIQSPVMALMFLRLADTSESEIDSVRLLD